MAILLTVLQNLRKREVEIIVNTKPFDELESNYRVQVIQAVSAIQNSDVSGLLTSKNHRNIAIIDADIRYEGSLIYCHKTIVEINASHALTDLW
jgi:hypothetical protein